MRILVIDDDVLVRTQVRGLLERAGFQVAEAGDGNAGVRAFHESPTDVVLCDVYMPERDGLEVIRDLTRSTPGVRIVAMSGVWTDGKGDLLPVARRLGAAGVLYKPFGPDALLEALRGAALAGA